MSIQVEKNKLELVEERLEKESFEYAKRLTEIFGLMKSVSQLNDAQILTLSLRQELVERKRDANFILNKQRSKYRTKMGERYVYYRTENSIRLDYREIKSLVECETNNILQIVELFESQIEFYNDTISTLTSVQFAIKNKIELEKGFI